MVSYALKYHLIKLKSPNLQVFRDCSVYMAVQSGQRWKNIWVCNQCSCKFCPSFGEIFAKLYTIFFICALYGDTYGKSLTFTSKRGNFVINHIIVASIDEWQSYFAHSFCKIQFTLFCCKFTFVAIYALFLVKSFWLKTCSCK